jgi:DUF1680 family protein
METVIYGPVAAREHRHLDSQAIPLNHVKFALDSELGFWQERNFKETLPHLIENLISTGALANLQELNTIKFQFKGMWFSDSDVHKTLEALSWNFTNFKDKELSDFYGVAAEAITAAQESDGYVNTYFQGPFPEKKWRNFGWGHEMYVAGHLIQAGVAEARVTGKGPIFAASVKFADLLVMKFNSKETLKLCGHPEIETALVELYRVTGTAEYLELAERMLMGRGYGTITNLDSQGGFHPASPSYLQDHKPIIEAATAVGHSVRQVYLNAAVMDLYMEKGDKRLLDIQEKQWNDMINTKMYATGGLGARHKDEAFGDSYELPNDRAYAETCASIGAFMWAWRLLLVTGNSKYSDVMELNLVNIISASISHDGCKYFYSNPLQYRSDHVTAFDTDASERLPWYTCSCCPPNLARLISSLHGYVASVTDDSLYLHLYSAGSIKTVLGNGQNVDIDIATNYPYEGTIKVKVNSPGKYGVKLRIPSWCSNPQLQVSGVNHDLSGVKSGYVEVNRTWSSMDEIVLHLPMNAEFLKPHPRIDAARGTVAIRRGPIIYAIEQADVQETGVYIDDFVVDAAAPIEELGLQMEGFPQVPVLQIVGNFINWGDELPYVTNPSITSSNLGKVSAIPYALWGNRSKGGMRVWIPVR